MTNKNTSNQSIVAQFTKEPTKPPNTLIAFDPGLSTGWCEFIKGEPSDIGTCRSIESLIDFMEDWDFTVDVIVMEKYALFKWLALQQSGSKMEVAQAEGIIKAWARRHNVELVEQSPQILPIAQMWSKVKLNKNHKLSHHESALNHGFYYLVTHNMREINK